MLGLIAGLTTLAEELVDPLMQMLRTVPFLALVPLFIVWFGIDETPKVVLIAGRDRVPHVPEHVRRRAQRRPQGDRGGAVVRPAPHPTRPRDRAAGRVAVDPRGVAVLARHLGGRVDRGRAGERDVGDRLPDDAGEFLRTDILMVCIVVYALLGLVFDLLVRLLERLFMPWRAGTVAR